MAADQPPETLPQLQRRRRQREVAEPVATGRLDGLATCLVQRITGGRERQLVDYEQRERLAGDVHALPEGRGCDQYRVDLRPEALEQALARLLALDEHLVGHLPADALAEHVECAVARGQDERPPRRETEERGALVGRALGKPVRARVGESAWHVQERLLAKVVGRADNELARVREAEPTAHEPRVLAGGQRRGDEDRRRPLVPEPFAELRRDVDRRPRDGVGLCPDDPSEWVGLEARLDLRDDRERAPREQVELLPTSVELLGKRPKRGREKRDRLGGRLAQAAPAPPRRHPPPQAGPPAPPAP